MKLIITVIFVKMLLKKDISYQDIVPILNGTLVMWLQKTRQEVIMAANTIIVILVGFIAVLAIVAYMIDNWRDNDDEDDWEPYG